MREEGKKGDETRSSHSKPPGSGVSLGVGEKGGKIGDVEESSLEVKGYPRGLLHATGKGGGAKGISQLKGGSRKASDSRRRGKKEQLADFSQV